MFLLNLILSVTNNNNKLSIQINNSICNIDIFGELIMLWYALDKDANIYCHIAIFDFKKIPHIEFSIYEEFELNKKSNFNNFEKIFSYKEFEDVFYSNSLEEFLSKTKLFYNNLMFI